MWHVLAPEQPENVTIEEYPQTYDDEGNHVYNIFLQWSTPRILPEYYMAMLRNFDNEFNVTINVPGVSRLKEMKYFWLFSRYIDFSHQFNILSKLETNEWTLIR